MALLELDGAVEFTLGQNSEVVLPYYMVMLCQKDLADVAASGDERIIAAGRDPASDHIIVVTNHGHFFGFSTDVAGPAIPSQSGRSVHVEGNEISLEEIVTKALPLTI